MKLPTPTLTCVLGMLLLLAATPLHAAIIVTSVGCPNLPVTSLDRSIAFYMGVLDFHLQGVNNFSDLTRLEPGMPANAQSFTAHMSLGDECLDLTEYRTPKGRPFPSGSRSNDLWFQHIAIVVSNMDEAYRLLRRDNVRFVSNTPQTLPQWNHEAAGISALYFRDPDGHYLELIHFPAGKGQPKWQIRSDALFLGIDHSAISIASTPRSLAFYRDRLHLHVTGTSDNYGSEQEHLSGVFDAHVLITSLRADNGIGVEFLDYLTPGSGRSILLSQGVNDIACWQLPLEVRESTSGLSEKSLHWITLPANREHDREAAWIKDPDGHVLELLRK